MSLACPCPKGPAGGTRCRHGVILLLFGVQQTHTLSSFATVMYRTYIVEMICGAANSAGHGRAADSSMQGKCEAVKPPGCRHVRVCKRPLRHPHKQIVTCFAPLDEQADQAELLGIARNVDVRGDARNPAAHPATQRRASRRSTNNIKMLPSAIWLLVCVEAHLQH